MNYNDFFHEINRMATNMRSSLIEPNSSSNKNSSCLKRHQKFDPHEYNESEKPIELPYDSSGLPLRYSNLNRIESPDLRLDTYNTSGKVFQLTDFIRDDAENGRGSIETYNTSGRVLHLSDLPEGSEEETGMFNTSIARGIDPKPYETHRFQQGDLETYDTSGLPLSMSKFANIRKRDLSDTDRTCSFQSCIGQHSNSNDWKERQTEKPRNEGGSRFEDTQCLQVPREEAWNTSNLSRTLGIPSLTFDQSELDFGNTQRNMGCQANDELYSIPGRNQSTCAQDMLECPQHSQRQFIELIKNKHANMITSNNYSKIPLFDALVKDNYYPGAIEDAVNGKINFNKIAFDAVFDSDPPMEIKPDDVPLSLLEAFELRIHFEDNGRKSPNRCFAFRKKEGAVESKDKTEEITTTKSPEELQFWVHPDELKLASTIDIDLGSNVREYPETHLTRAIASLFKAEKMNEFDKRVHVAEEAMRSVPRDQQEKVAFKSIPSFKVNLQKGEKVTTKSYKPIEIVSYIGTTKPNE